MTEELLSSATFAEATLPCFLKISESRIPTAGRGVFTKKYKIPKGIIFGPYLVRQIKYSQIKPSHIFQVFLGKKNKSERRGS